ncbi:cytochrome c oxidase subunit II [Paenibacillus sp. y28]|uniref:cytochrome c oxidase subunit II n=1 Tax=Paenibacillus sp. y28 TaxID=3129110 RepID=UPI00301803C6
MHMHKYEKGWLAFGGSMIVIFLVVLGIGAFTMGMAPPGSHTHAIDPERIKETAPFDKPGLRHLGDNEYEAVMIGQAFGYLPENMEVPVGAKVNFIVTSPDVVHGFAIPGTNVNLMVVPGEVNHLSHTFNEPGTYLVICNEYCGIGHEFMKTTIVVK